MQAKESPEKSDTANSTQPTTPAPKPGKDKQDKKDGKEERTIEAPTSPETVEALRKTTAANITALRQAHKMTQLELGCALNYSDKAVSKWERGDAIPDAFVLLQISRLFGVSVDYLLSDHTGEPPPTVSRRHRVNYVILMLLTAMGILTVAIVVFLVLFLCDIRQPLVFQFAVPIIFIVLTVFNTIWGKRKHNFYFISGIAWSLICTVYLIFLSLSYNWWQILILILPAQLIILLCFHLKLPKFRKQ